MAYISFQPKDHFSTKLYSGNGSTNAQTGVGFEPDWIWIKNRDGGGGSHDHYVFDQVRGTTKYVRPNESNAEGTASGVTSFDSDGFTLGSSDGMNENGRTFAAWNWKANGQGSSNTDGSINTTYTSANTTSGFSISTYTGTGSAATIGHGLGAKPAMIIVKRLTGSAEAWTVYHQSLDASAPQDKYLHLNSTDAVMDSAGMWNDTAPTTSVFSVGSTGVTNGSGGTFVAYCFAEKKGFSAMGSYTGNGNADGTFVYTGFKPAFILLKQTSSSGNDWWILDSKRLGFNPSNSLLRASRSNAELANTDIDLVSNGFKIKSTDGGINASGENYIYIAFAEEPLVSSNGVAATAR